MPKTIQVDIKPENVKVIHEKSTAFDFYGNLDKSSGTIVTTNTDRMLIFLSSNVVSAL